MQLDDAISSRRSVRGFLPDAVPEEVLQRVFEKAQRAPSWCNIQPWRVFLTSGETTGKLRDALVAATTTEMPSPDFDWPPSYPEPYGAHRKECGKALYEAMGVARDDRAGRHAAWVRNFEAFMAPHIAIVCVDKRFGLYGALDVGCWLQTVMLLLREEGLHSCAQASLATYPRLTREILNIPDELGVLCGIAIGKEDESVPANATRTVRSPVEDNITFR